MMLSAIVCAHNEANNIGKLLANLAGQRLPDEIEEFEILVVASGCTDRTTSIVEGFKSSNPKIRLIEEEERRGKASALNLGLMEARGDVLAILPADIQPADDGLYHLLLPFRSENVMIVTGQPVQHPKAKVKGLVGYINQMTFRIWGRLIAKLNDMGMAAHCSGEFMAMRAGVVEKIPEESAADDSYIAVMGRRKGLIKYSSRAVAYNIMPSNLRDYVNQRRRWLFGHFQTQQLTGENPTVMDTVFFSKTATSLKVLVEEVSEDLGRIPYLCAAILLEGLIYVLAVGDSILDKEYGIWPVIQSTKVKFGN